MPDPITNPQAFRLFLEAETDPEALSGSFQFLKRDKDADWNNPKREAIRAVIETAVERRLKEIA